MSCPRRLTNIGTSMKFHQFLGKSRQDMTYLKPQTDADIKKASNKTNELKRKNESAPFWLKERFIQSCAWILLTIGLCIIVITFFLAIHGKHNDSDGSLETGDGIAAASSNLTNFGSGFDIIGGPGSEGGTWLDSEPDGRLNIDDVFGTITANLDGCQEKLCKIMCTNDANIYKSVHKTMKASSCPSIDILLLDSQDFADNTLNNSWKHVNLSIYEVVIRSSNLTNIKSNAFNSPIFTNTILMSWLNLDIQRVESGALLGLYKLKYLTIDSVIRKLEPAFFQPVQTTLTHLKLNADLLLRGNRSLFGVNNMMQMEYLDISYNRINGTLGHKMFSSTPNLKYLIMTDVQLEYIDRNAFAPLSNTLTFLNLSKNLLTTLAAELIEVILRNNVGAMISLSRNNWICDCEMQALTTLYKNYRNQFIDAVYCRAPHDQYGLSIDEVDYGRQNCELVSTTLQGPVEEKDDSVETTPTTSTVKTTEIYSNTPKMDFDSSDLVESGETPPTDLSSAFKVRCLNVDSEASFASISVETLERSIDQTAEVKYFDFDPPLHEFDLQLNAENNSVVISIENPTDLVVIWFSEQQEAEFVTYNDKSVDYECMRYAQPHLTVGPLAENTTYTFCLVPPFSQSISPFNCLPLHVPLKRQENIWISQDNKQFTIGMLCLIFLVSTILGALVAYFGIKTYPDLLEGSKNVLVVKKPDHECYVATISETEYMKQSSLKKRKLSTKDDDKKVPATKESLKKKSSVNGPLPATPRLILPPESPPPTFHMSVRNLESLSSQVSSSTCFEEAFPTGYAYNDEDYETPRLFENEYSVEQRSVPNSYGMSPGSPPPLPKRNSNISDSPTVAMNRFSRNM